LDGGLVAAEVGRERDAETLRGEPEDAADADRREGGEAPFPGFRGVGRVAVADPGQDGPEDAGEQKNEGVGGKVDDLAAAEKWCGSGLAHGRENASAGRAGRSSRNPAGICPPAGGTSCLGGIASSSLTQTVRPPPAGFALVLEGRPPCRPPWSPKLYHDPPRPGRVLALRWGGRMCMLIRFNPVLSA